MNVVTGREFKGAAKSSAWRWNMSARPMSILGAVRKRMGRASPRSARFWSLAPPSRNHMPHRFLMAGELVIAHAANILLYLGDRHDLVPADDVDRLYGPDF